MDTKFMKEAIEAAKKAVEHGNEPLQNYRYNRQ